jgi:hypothetical protein
VALGNSGLTHLRQHASSNISPGQCCDARNKRRSRVRQGRSVAVVLERRGRRVLQGRQLRASYGVADGLGRDTFRELQLDEMGRSGRQRRAASAESRMAMIATLTAERSALRHDSLDDAG